MQSHYFPKHYWMFNWNRGFLIYLSTTDNLYTTNGTWPESLIPWSEYRVSPKYFFFGRGDIHYFTVRECVAISCKKLSGWNIHQSIRRVFFHMFSYLSILNKGTIQFNMMKGITSVLKSNFHQIYAFYSCPIYSSLGPTSGFLDSLEFYAAH